MVVAGLGMGLLQPVYTLAVQNVAPRAADGRGHLVDDLLSIDRQHGRRRGVRLDHARRAYHDGVQRARCRRTCPPLRADRTSRIRCCWCTVRPRDGGCLQPHSRADSALLLRRCSTTRASLASGLHLIGVCSRRDPWRSAIMLHLAAAQRAACAPATAEPELAAALTANLRTAVAADTSRDAVMSVGGARRGSATPMSSGRSGTEAHHRAAGNAHRAAADVDAGDACRGLSLARPWYRCASSRFGSAWRA